MFSIFEYLGRRSCDSVLAGVYDAVEIIEASNFDLPPVAGEIPGSGTTGKAISDSETLLRESLQGMAGATGKAASDSETLLREGLQGMAGGKKPAPAENAGHQQTQKKSPPAPPQPTKPGGQATEPKPASAPKPPFPNQPTAVKDKFGADLFGGTNGQERPLPSRKRGRPRKFPPGRGTQ